MPYKGPPVVCRFCGQSFTRPESLVRHLDGRRCSGRSSAIIPAKRARPARVDAPRAIQGEVLDVTPSRLEIVPARRESAPPRPVLARSGDEPSWFQSKFPQDAKAMRWRERDEGSREFYRKAHAAMQGITVRRPDGVEDSATLWEQFHFLKALAVRLDAGRGTERDRSIFEVGLREFNANYDRIRAQRKALPG